MTQNEIFENVENVRRFSYEYKKGGDNSKDKMLESNAKKSIHFLKQKVKDYSKTIKKNRNLIMPKEINKYISSAEKNYQTAKKLVDDCDSQVKDCTTIIKSKIESLKPKIRKSVSNTSDAAAISNKISTLNRTLGSLFSEVEEKLPCIKNMLYSMRGEEKSIISNIFGGDTNKTKSNFVIGADKAKNDINEIENLYKKIVSKKGSKLSILTNSEKFGFSSIEKELEKLSNPSNGKVCLKYKSLENSLFKKYVILLSRMENFKKIPICDDITAIDNMIKQYKSGWYDCSMCMSNVSSIEYISKIEIKNDADFESTLKDIFSKNNSLDMSKTSNSDPMYRLAFIHVAYGSQLKLLETLSKEIKNLKKAINSILATKLDYFKAIMKTTGKIILTIVSLGLKISCCIIGLSGITKGIATMIKSANTVFSTTMSSKADIMKLAGLLP